MIENMINHKKYIGQSKDIHLRWIHHKADLRCGTHHNIHLQSSWNIYGEENFRFSIIEETTLDEIDNREKYWISYYDSYYNGYNLDFGGSGCHGFKHTENEIEKMRKIQSPLPILQFDLNFNFVQYWLGGSSHICKQLNYTRECISIRCDHKISHMTPYKNCYWVYEDEYLNDNFSWDSYMENIAILPVSKKTVQEKKKIIQYTLDRKVIRVWDTLKDIRDEGYHTTSISSVLNHSRGKKSAYGYIWCYEDYDFSDGYFDTLDKYHNKAIEDKKRITCMVDPDTMQILHRFNSCSEAADYMGVKPPNICVAAKSFGKKKSCGYYWKYA